MPAVFPELQAILSRLDTRLEQLQQVAEEFPEDRIWQRPRPGIVSLGNLICHAAGSMRDWLENGLGEGHWPRDRSAEFQREGGMSREELIDHLFTTRRHCQTFLDAIDETSWLETRQFRGKAYTVREIVLHQVEHVAYHAGQAAFLRWLVGGLPPKPL